MTVRSLTEGLTEPPQVCVHVLTFSVWAGRGPTARHPTRTQGLPCPPLSTPLRSWAHSGPWGGASAEHPSERVVRAQNTEKVIIVTSDPTATQMCMSPRHGSHAS